MAYGLMNLQGQIENSALDGLANAANLEQQRKANNQQLAQQDKAGRMNSVATGAGLGFAVGGPVGAGVGAGVGLLAYNFL